jgi:hypothetical protein
MSDRYEDKYGCTPCASDQLAELSHLYGDQRCSDGKRVSSSRYVARVVQEHVATLESHIADLKAKLKEASL